jgi:hypothetical protein
MPKTRLAQTIAALSLLNLSALAQAPTAPAAAPPPYVRVQYFNNDGSPCAGCALWTYAAGGNTPLSTFTDQTAMTANTDPVILDGSGRAAIYITDLAYKFVLENPIPTGMTHGATIWTVDNIVDTGLIALGASGGGISTANITYTPPFSGSVGINLGVYLLSQMLDVRSFGATGYTGNCAALTQDDQPYIQAALNYANAHGPATVFLPPGYCWPIGSHLWIPPLTTFAGGGRTSGYENSSSGSLLIANSHWAATNTTFPYSQMIWVTGSNQTSGTFLASGSNFGSVVQDMEISCADAVGCGNVLAVGRAEKSRLHNLLLTGGVPFSGGYGYGFYEQGGDCNGGTPPASGCLLQSSGSGNPFSNQQGPDDLIEIFPSYNTPSANFILYAEMGALNYKGLRDSTLNGIGAGGGFGGYIWGNTVTMGPGIHIEGASVATPPFNTFSNGLYIGNIPAGSSCTGGVDMVFIGMDTPTAIAGSCAAQQRLTFIGNSPGVINNANLTVNAQSDYFYSAGPPTVSGWIGVDGPVNTASNITVADPGEYVHNGYNGLNFWNGNSHSGINEQVLLDANSIFIRGFFGSDMWWNHATGLWNTGGNGGNDASSMLFLNGGATTLCGSTAISGTVSMAAWLGDCEFVYSGSGNTLIGPGWVSTTTGGTQGEGTDPLQVKGNVNMTGTLRGAVQFGSSSSSSCPTASSDGSTCNFGVTWGTPYANSTYPVTCSLLDPTGSPHVKGITRSTGGVTVIIQNGSAAQAVASGGSGVACIAGPNP